MLLILQPQNRQGKKQQNDRLASPLLYWKNVSLHKTVVEKKKISKDLNHTITTLGGMPPMRESSFMSLI